MIKNLHKSGILAFEADYLVIGAGTVGLPTSVWLARLTGKTVICLESGSYQQEDETHPLNEVVQASTAYAGAVEGRFRCLGGTSTRWGGSLVPFQRNDIALAGWPISPEELERYIPEIETLFQLEGGPYRDTKFPIKLPKDFVNRLAKWPTFRNRNVYNLLKSECTHLSNLEIWINATVTELRCSEVSGRVSIKARSLDSDELTVDAKNVIVAAGAIETTRLALLVDRQNEAIISRISPALGKYFTDHLSVPVATIETDKPSELNHIVGFYFGKQGSMRNVRFELADDSPLRKSLPPWYMHISYDLLDGGGFEAVREMLRFFQMIRIPPLSIFLRLLRYFPWLVRAVWWRFVHMRLLFPDKAKLVAHVVIDQEPTEQNHISLSNTVYDSLGVPLPIIDWSISCEDVNKLMRTVDFIEGMWNDSEFASYGTWRRHTVTEIKDDLMKCGGIFHPTGSTRMADDPDAGVVDKNLRLFALPQVQLLATSVLPTGGGANPTMTLLLLARRCVDQHAGQA